MSVTPSCAIDRTVGQLDHRVDDRLRVDDDVDLIGADAEQPVRLDDLEALVHQRRRIDGDLAAHAPGRMPQRLLGGHAEQFRRAPAAKRSARGGQDEPADLATRRARAGTGESRCARCRPAGSRRRAGARPPSRSRRPSPGLPCSRARSSSRARSRPAPLRALRCPTTRRARDRRRVRSRPRPGRRGPFPRSAASCTPVGAKPIERLARRHRDDARPVARDLLAEQLGILAGREADDRQAIGMRVDDGQRALPDRSGRAEDGDAFHAQRPEAGGWRLGLEEQVPGLRASSLG